MNIYISDKQVPMNIPQDIISYCIFPYLRVEDAIEFNKVLQEDQRVIRKISKDKLIEFTILYSNSLLGRFLKNSVLVKRPQNEKNRVKRRIVLRMFRKYKRYAPGLQYSSKLRNVYISRLYDFAEEEMDGSTELFRIACCKVRGQILQSLDELYPFIENKICENGELSSYSR